MSLLESTLFTKWSEALSSARHKLLAVRRQEGVEEIKRKGIIIDRKVTLNTYLKFCKEEPRVQGMLTGIMTNWNDQLWIMVEIASTESLNHVHEKVAIYFSQRTTIQIYIAIKIFPPHLNGTFALLALLYLRNSSTPSIPLIAKSFGTAPLHNMTQMYLQDTLHVQNNSGVEFGEVPCDDANIPQYQIDIPTALLFDDVPDGVPADVPDNFTIDLWRLKH
ncbi:25126_t:CDS:2, partial [Dentiscutata erythropus]